MTFKSFLQQKNIITKTISRHHREVQRYEQWLKQHHQTTAQAATKKQLLHYLKHLKDSRQLANATQSQVLQTLKNYYQYLSQRHGTQNIAHLIKIRGTLRKHLRPLFTPEQLEQLCDAYYYHTQEYQPNRKELYYYPNHKHLLQGRHLALTLIACQALKPEEILKLTPDNFDTRKGTLHLHANRRAAARTLPLEASQIGTIINHFAQQPEGFILPNLNQIERLSNTLKEITRQSTPQFLDFRQLKASRITHWIKLHGLRKAQYLAGHRNITNTEQYLNGDFDQLQQQLHNFHPMG